MVLKEDDSIKRELDKDPVKSEFSEVRMGSIWQIGPAYPTLTWEQWLKGVGVKLFGNYH
jgi:hypothetical protein